MNVQRVYRLLQPGNPDPWAWTWRCIHHLMIAAGIGIVLVLTVKDLQEAYGDALTDAFDIVALFFVVDYLLRFYAVAGVPGAQERGVWRSRIAWATSLAGIYDLLAAIPGLIALRASHDAVLIGFIWCFKCIRYSPGLSILERVITHARHALASVLLGLVLVLLTAASLAYILERDTNPEGFGSIPSALWWAIVTLTTTGYGDVSPHTTPGKILAAVVMVCGIMVFALIAGILTTAYADEMRRREFLRTWELVAKVPFFHNLGATLIAEVARLLRVQEYAKNSVIMRRGETSNCMYFIADGEVEIQIDGRPRLDAGGFFGELALLTGAPRTATVTAVRSCTLLTLDIVDFLELIARHPGLARVIHEEAIKRLGPGVPLHAALRATIARDREPVA